MHSKFLKYFDEVSKRGSIRQAADALNVSASSVNRKIIDIEHQLGVKLFSRHADGVELTDAGIVLLEHCRKTLFDYDKVLRAIGDVRELRVGHINIATLDSVAEKILPEAIQNFANDYPDISYKVTIAGPNEVSRLVADGKVSIGISFTNNLPSGARSRMEKSAPIGAIVANNHPLAERDLIELDDLLAYPLIRSDQNLEKRCLIDITRENAQNPNPSVIQTNNIPMARSIIKSGYAVGLYSKVGFINEIEKETLRFIPLSARYLQDIKLGIIISCRTNQTPIEDALSRILIRSFKSLKLD